MLEVENMNVGYGENIIIKNINISFEKNKIYGLIGRNGAGKSTFLRTLSRLQKELSGSLRLDGQPLKNVDYFDMDLTFISDEHSFFQDLTMYEQLVFLCKLNKISKENAKKKIDYVISRFKLQEYANYYPHACSRGTIQRFAIVCGYLRKSSMLFLDEPFITLDPVQIKTLENVLVEYKNDNNFIIVSSHDLDSLEKICDEYLVIIRNKLVHFHADEISVGHIADIIGDSYDKK